MTAAPTEPCLLCGKDITFQQWFEEECPSDPGQHPCEKHETASPAGPPAPIPDGNDRYGEEGWSSYA